jgi:succinate dehydrogenase / fumarate reductase cytochrome b subunit
MSARPSGPRPFFLNLLQIRLPIGGYVSILHRVTGAAMCLAVPLAVYVWMLSLRSAADYATVTDLLGGGLGWLIGMGLLWALLHHFFAGLRHLGFDLGLGEDKATARATAWAVLGAGLGLTGLIALGSLL